MGERRVAKHGVKINSGKKKPKRKSFRPRSGPRNVETYSALPDCGSEHYQSTSLHVDDLAAGTSDDPNQRQIER